MHFTWLVKSLNMDYMPRYDPKTRQELSPSPISHLFNRSENCLITLSFIEPCLPNGTIV
jgi:hypothetical protein